MASHAMGKFVPASWARAACSWILVAICASEGSTSTSNVYESTTEMYRMTLGIETTTYRVNEIESIELDYMDPLKPSSKQITFSRTSTSPRYHISVRQNPGLDRQFKVLVVLENMVCDSNNTDRAHVWVEGTNWWDKQIVCEDSQVKKVIMDKHSRISIGTSEFWGTDGVNNATIRVTAYYDAQSSCRCHSSLSFCCTPCKTKPYKDIDRDSNTGYCINKDFRCNFRVYCPCGATDIPDAEPCDWYFEEGLIRVSMSLMMIYFVLGVCVAVGITYLVPYFCRRRRGRTPGSHSGSGAHDCQHSDAENPPPSYESTTAEEYSLQHFKILADEPPPPSYETVVKE